MKNRPWSGLGLTPRIGIVIILTLAATQILYRLLIALAPPPSILFYTRDWLAEQTDAAVRLSLSIRPEQRRAALSAMDTDWLAFSLRTNAPPAALDEPPALQVLSRAIAMKLGPKSPPVVVLAESLDTPDRATSAIAVVIAEMPAILFDIFDDDFQEAVIVASQLQIVVDLRDGTWLTVAKPTGHLAGALHLRNFAVLAGGLLLIAGMSLIAARSIIRPLGQLASAADRLGREREPTLIAQSGVAELDAIGRSFNEMQRRLKRFVDERTQMLAAISHDLRTPLTRLRLFAECVPDEQQRRHVLEDIAEMESMIRASLVFAGDESRREVHSRVDIAALSISLCDVVSDAGDTATYEGPDHAEIPCQPVAMRRALANLVDNACKYGHQASVCLRDAPGAIEITIADFGPGIPADQIELAFAPFQRLDGSRNRASGGVGLGLTIARDVIHGHGGEISLESNAPTGLLVKVHLPKPREASASTAPTTSHVAGMNAAPQSRRD